MIYILKNLLEINLKSKSCFKSNHYLLKLITHFLPTFKMGNRTK